MKIYSVLFLTYIKFHRPPENKIKQFLATYILKFSEALHVSIFLCKNYIQLTTSKPKNFYYEPKFIYKSTLLYE